jgi:formylglycine-generating enzyme required for sulfatase activity
MNAENPAQLKAAYSYRVRRGGSWFAIGDNAWAEERRDNDPSTRDRFLTLGFRLVRNR